MALENLIALGKLVNVHATHGELRMLPFNPDTDTLHAGSSVILRRSGELRHIRVHAVRRHKRFLLLTLEGCDSMSAAEDLVGCEVCVPEQDLPPAHGDEIYHYQLLGMAVVTTAGALLGTVAEVFDTPSHAVCVVRNDQQEHLIPLVAGIVCAIDHQGRRLVIEPPPGLLDD